MIAAAPDLLESLDPELLMKAANKLDENAHPNLASQLEELANKQRAAIKKATEE